MTFCRATGIAGVLMVSAVVVGGCGGSDGDSSPAPLACSELTTSAGLAAAKLPVNGTTITSATLVPAVPAAGATPATPAHCEVIGRIGARTGVDGQSYATTFRMRMPVASGWNGRFYMFGGAGTDGLLSDNLAFYGPLLSMGYATIGNDGGHDNTRNYNAVGGAQAFGLDPQARTDYGYNSLDVTARTGKALIQATYGRAASKSYFAGCSNGGRDAMMMAQRFPTYFDGIIAGAPAFRVPYASLGSAHAIQIASELVEPGYKSRNASPAMANAFTSADLGLVRGAILGACDALDGAADGMVQRFEQCTDALVHPALDALVCPGAKSPTCLTSAQVDGVKRMNAGPTTSLGQSLYAKWPWDPGHWEPTASSLPAWSFGSAGGNFGATLVPGAMAMVFTTPPQPTAVTDFTRYMQYVDIDATALSYRFTTSLFTQSTDHFMLANDPDLSRFKQHGGKIVFYHGMADGIFSIMDTVDYYKRMDAAVGGKASEFARLFPQAGMGHCSGGPGATQIDVLNRLVNWVEQGTSPDGMIATAIPGSGFTGRTRPLCAYPTVPVYSGSGSIEDAVNFSCQ